MCYRSRVMYCQVLQSHWTVDCYLWVQRSSTLGPQPFCHAREELWCHEQPSVKSAREQHSRTRLWVLLPERRNEQGHASSTAVRATGMERGVANAGSTAVWSSSLLLSATLPECRHRNPACEMSAGKWRRPEGWETVAWCSAPQGTGAKRAQRKAFARGEVQQWLRQRHVPLNTWQPDHVYAVFEQTSHLNMPTWAWAEQLHAPRWRPDSQMTSMQFSNKHAT